MTKVQKGNFGYLKNQTKIEIMKTIVLYAISAAIFLLGYLTTHDKKNLLTIVAVLGCIPASNSLVHLIMFLKAKGCSESLHGLIEGLGTFSSYGYDVYMTSYKKNFSISHFVVKNRNLCMITEDEQFDEKACQEHLKLMFGQNGIKDVTVKIFTDPEKYAARLRELAESDMEELPNLQNQVVDLLGELSL